MYFYLFGRVALIAQFLKWSGLIVILGFMLACSICMMLAVNFLCKSLEAKIN